MNKTFLVSLSLIAVLTVGSCATTQTTSKRHGKYVDNDLVKSSGLPQTKEDLAEAVTMYERLYLRNANDPEIAIKYAEVLRKSGELQRAHAVLSTHARRRNAAPATLLEYARINAVLGNFDLTEEFAQKALKSRGSKAFKARAAHILGVALDAQGKHGAAEKQFRTALENWEGDRAPLLNNLALALAQQGFFDEALDTLHHAYVANPDHDEISRNIELINSLRAEVIKK